MSKFDLVFIGSGPGGYIGAIRAAQLGMKVAVIERDKPGGICLNWGCIPSKAILKCAEVYDTFKHAADYGINAGKITVDYPKVIQKSRKAADTLSKGVEFLFKKNGVTLFNGTGKLLSPNNIGIQGVRHESEIEAYNVMLCTGSVPKTLPGTNVDGKSIMTSDEAIISPDIPASIVIIGGGPVGVEFAYIYNAFGSKVTLVEMESTLLPGVDSEVAKELEKQFKRIGIKVMTGTKTNGITKLKSDVKVLLDGKTKPSDNSLTAEKVLIAIGRAAAVESLGLEGVGVELDSRGFIMTDSTYLTSVSGIYAIGDVIGPPLLAHKASEEGVIAVENMSGLPTNTVNYERIPSCVYCQPEVASIGLSEEQCKEQGLSINIGKFPFKASGKAVATGQTRGFVKIISEKNSGEILGAHIVGSGATELIAEIGLAKTLESTLLEIAQTPHAHPTLSEAIMESALGALGRSRNI